MPLALLFGCAGSIDGIWLAELAYDDHAACATQVDHNFDDSYAAEEGPWSETWLRDHSEALVLAQITQSDATTAVMVVGSEVRPGSEKNGKWTFTWTATDFVQHATEHDEGYVYGEDTDRTDEETITLTVDGDSAKGTWKATSEELLSYSESDEWDSTVGVDAGVIPASDYLNYDVPNVGSFPRTNTRTDAECAGAQCSLDVLTTCEGSFRVTMTRTGYDDQGAYDQLEDVGHPYGTGS